MRQVDKRDVPAGRLRRIAASVMLLVAAGAAFFSIAALVLSRLMRPSDGVTELSTRVGLLAILILLITALWLEWTRGMSGLRRPAALAALMLFAGLLPWGVDAIRESMAASRRQAEDRRYESEFMRRLSGYRDDVAARVRDTRSYAPAEALALVEFVQGSDLGWRSLPDHWDEALPLLVRALDGAILDPNGMVKGPRAVDVRPEPLFVHFYRFHVAPLRSAQVRPRDRMILSLLLDHGADLSAEAAAPLAAAITAARTAPAPP